MSMCMGKNLCFLTLLFSLTSVPYHFKWKHALKLRTECWGTIYLQYSLHTDNRLESESEVPVLVGENEQLKIEGGCSTALKDLPLLKYTGP